MKNPFARREQHDTTWERLRQLNEFEKKMIEDSRQQWQDFVRCQLDEQTRVEDVAKIIEIADRLLEAYRERFTG